MKKLTALLMALLLMIVPALAEPSPEDCAHVMGDWYNGGEYLSDPITPSQCAILVTDYFSDCIYCDYFEVHQVFSVVEHSLIEYPDFDWCERCHMIFEKAR